jgi:hypothetical protein
MANTIGPAVAAGAPLVRSYAEALIKGVAPSTFARLAVVEGKVIQSNHPCWVFGHLSIYHERIMDLLGLPRGAAERPAGFEALFKNGTPCLDDPQGTIYPSMDAVMGYFFAGQALAMEAVKFADDSVLLAPNPAEGRMKELFPTKGMVMGFLMGAHPMMHIGQASAWRRMMGMGSAM